MKFSPYKYLSVLLVIVLPGAVWSQSGLPDKHKRNMVINESGYTINAEVLAKARNIQAKPDMEYYWYKSNKILKTQGGSDGKLLHGRYITFYLDKNLKEKGKFRYGLKTGQWTSWSEGGKIREITNWREGRKHGMYKLFNEKGEMIEQGRYCQEKLNGRITAYENGTVVSVKKYKKGEPVNGEEAKPEKQKKKLFGSFSLNKKDKAASQDKQPKEEKQKKQEKEKTPKQDKK